MSPTAATPIINTTRGPKSPDEALALFLNTKDTGTRLGVFRGLIEHAPGMAQVIVDIATANPGVYGDAVDRAVQRLVDERAGLPPRGPQKVLGFEQLWELFAQVEAGTRFKLNFKRDALGSMISVQPIMRSGALVFDRDGDSDALLGVVCAREWGSDSRRTYQVKTTDTFESRFEWIAATLWPLLDTIEFLRD